MLECLINDLEGEFSEEGLYKVLTTLPPVDDGWNAPQFEKHTGVLAANLSDVLLNGSSSKTY